MVPAQSKLIPRPLVVVIPALTFSFLRPRQLFQSFLDRGGRAAGVGCTSSLPRCALHCADWLLLPDQLPVHTLLQKPDVAVTRHLCETFSPALQNFHQQHCCTTAWTWLYLTDIICGLLIFCCSSRMRNLGFWLLVPVLLEPSASADLHFLVLFDCSPVCKDWNAATFISNGFMVPPQ